MALAWAQFRRGRYVSQNQLLLEGENIKKSWMFKIFTGFQAFLPRVLFGNKRGNFETL